MKSELKKLKDYADKLMSVYVIIRDKKCVCCGRIDTLQAGHYISRTKTIIKWDRQNVNCQCAGCNIQHNNNPVPYTKYLQSRYGNQVIDNLNELAKMNNGYKLRKTSLEEIIEQIKSDIIELCEEDYCFDTEGIKMMLNKRSATITQMINYIRGE